MNVVGLLLRSATAWVPACLVAAAAGTAAAAGPSTGFTLAGAPAPPSVRTRGTLDDRAPVTQTVGDLSGPASQTRAHVGSSARTLVGAAQPVPLDGVQLATGSDGYRTVVALGEPGPLYGNLPSAVASADVVGGVAQPPGSDGFGRTSAPGDVRGGRRVSDLVNPDVRASRAPDPGGGRSTSFSVGGAVAAGADFDLAALQALPTETRVVNGVGYTGVSFWSLLATTVGLRLDPAVRNDLLNRYVVATGSDGHRSVFSLGELSADFGNEPALIAFDADGAGLGDRGFARLVVPNDVSRGRWVANLVRLEVFSAAPVPEPPAAVLLPGPGASALGVRPRWPGSRSTP